MTPASTSNRRRMRQPGAMNPPCNLRSRSGLRKVACATLVALGLIGLPGCTSTNPRPKVIAVPGEDVPHKIQRGEVSEYDGWVLPTPLFNRLTPCFKDVLEHPETRDVQRPFGPGPFDQVR